MNNNLLTPEKIEEIRLQAFLGSAYQRIFILRGEIGRMEAELESLPPSAMPESAEESAGMSEERTRSLASRIYLSMLIGKANQELSWLESQITDQTS